MSRHSPDYNRGAAMGELSGDSVTLVRPLASTRAQTRDSRHTVTHEASLPIAPQKQRPLQSKGNHYFKVSGLQCHRPSTGKTAMFSISILQNWTQALVLAPTTELAQQIQKGLLALGDYMGGVLACLSWALMSAKTAGWVPLHSGVEVGHIVRDANSHSGRHLNTRRICWLTEKMHSRGFTISALHGPEGEGCHHEGVQVWLQQSTHRYGLIGSELMCSRFLGHLPTKRENNIRRIGRGGCFGRKGVAVNCEEEKCVLRDIKTFCNTTVDEMPFECG